MVSFRHTDADALAVQSGRQSDCRAVRPSLVGLRSRRRRAGAGGQGVAPWSRGAGLCADGGDNRADPAWHRNPAQRREYCDRRLASGERGAAVDRYALGWPCAWQRKAGGTGMKPIAAVYAVFSGPEEAERIGLAMVEQRLAACVNILGPCRSIFRWQGQVQQAQEAAAVFKTTADRAPALIEA